MNGLSRDIVNRLTESLKSEMVKYNSGEYALGFSGGLDSTVLMVASGLSLKPYTVGFQNSRDLENSGKASGVLGFSSRNIILDDLDISRYVSDLRKIDGEISKSDMGYELILMILLDNIEEEFLVTGQGSDELFYGYRRFIDDPGLSNSGHLEKLYSVTLPREKKIAEYYGKSLITPYLSPEIVDIARDLPRYLNVEGERNKILLRSAAENLGIPDNIRETRKKAAQYGSGISRFLKKSLS